MIKVGDWVISTSWINSEPRQIIKIELATSSDEEDYVFFSDSCCVELKYIEKWIPEPGEWCWFMNKDRIPTLSQFVEFHEDINKYFATYPNKPNSFGAYYTKCEPFIGKLPSNIKGFNK